MADSYSFVRQRGIYSELVNPENAFSLKEDIQAGPSEKLLITKSKKQRIPKAIGISKQNRRETHFKADADIISVDPKVMEPYDPIPGRVPRRVAIDRKRKEYASFDIDELLMLEGVDYSSIPEHLEWLPLDLFDDTSFDDFSCEEWLEKAEIEKEFNHALIGRGLIKIEDNYEWSRLVIEAYNPKTSLLQVKWLETQDYGEIHRLFVLLDAEDPRKYAKRVAKAHQQRIYTDSFIRYNFYVDNMPMQDLNELDTEQKKRLEFLAKTKKLENIETTTLLIEVNNDYMRTMNKIIFDKYCEVSADDLSNQEVFPIKLVLPPPESDNIEYFGMMQLERKKGVKDAYMWNYREIFYTEPKDFNETFKEFCFASLFIKEEVIKALQRIREDCNDCEKMDIFQLNKSKLPEIMKMEEFKHIQDSATSQILYHLRGTWVNELVKIIKNEFSGVGKGWFNMKETSRITYDFGKLKRFLTVVRLMMQDTLLTIIKRSYFNFYAFMKSHIPDSVHIESPMRVTNIYSDDVNNVHTPLFQIDLMRTLSETDFVYSTNPEKYGQTILVIFDKALEELAKVSDIEPKILHSLYASQKNESHIKVPIKPKEKPKGSEGDKGYIPDENKWVWDLFQDFTSLMERAIAPLTIYLKEFDAFKDILHLKPDEIVREIEMDENPWDEEKIRAKVLETQAKERKLRETVPERIHVSCFKIECSDLLIHMCDKYQTLSSNLVDLIAKKAREKTQSVLNTFEEMKTKLNEAPTDIEKLVDIKEYMNSLPGDLEKTKFEIGGALDIYEMLESMNYKFTYYDLHKRWTIVGGARNIQILMQDRQYALEKEKVKFLDQMKESKEEFISNISNLEKTILSFHSNQNLKDHKKIAEDVISINENLTKYIEQAKKFNSHESLFDAEVTDFNNLSQMSRDFLPYSNLWLTASKWFTGHHSWLHGEWDTVDAEKAAIFVEDGYKSLQQSIRTFRDREMTPMVKIAESVRDEIKDFQKIVPLLVALHKNGMKERHWKGGISKLMGFEVVPDHDFTLQKALDLGLMKNVEQIVEIGERASKEFGIEMMLKDMEEKWENINFQLLPYKKDTHIIRGYDDIQAVLDEHLVNTQAMQFSPFREPYEDEIIKWSTQLKLMSDILEEWAKCQGQWMYLQPIFDSPDIAKQLPVETKKFNTVHNIWIHTMKQAFGLENVLRMCTQEGLLERLQEANKNLEMIQKALNDYLEKKREKFSRFYFLSNDELLEILSQTKEPTAVQPHLKKVFENIHEIEFDEGKRIHAMFSAEKEKVPFVKFVDPNNKNVEDWMGEVEDMMKKSVRAAFLRSIEDYTNSNRSNWVRSHPGQCVLNGSQVLWTKEVEEALAEEDGLETYFEKLGVQLNEMVELVRQKLTKQQQVTLNALIVIDVHAKDVVEKLINGEVIDPASFEWISQLRYYWENDNCFVKCIQTCFPYGYEYLGNTLRLVITPLTDKCYMTLMGALKLNLGGAPAGPAGTGKTESTKDLAKALAKQCVVFNCSDSMDYIMVGKFFKGLAASGAWCCFDEFNRINIEVLSVIAQQLQTLFSEKSLGTAKVLFEGSMIRINPTFSVFITMNPGYAGRTELPDNLKALFRPVAMMVPDYAAIGEIMLYSFGFKHGRELSRKMVATFKLSSEQLSSQDHYDYGMRAVRSVINAAGLLKSSEPNMDEDKLLLRALRDVNVPKFLKDDLPLFENIIKDLFPGITKPEVDSVKLMNSVLKACEEMKLKPVQSFIDKLFQLYDTIQVRHGLMLVGPTGGGKTSNYKVLQKAMTSLNNIDDFRKVHTHILNPKSIKMGQLYGDFNEQTHEWTDGILAYMIRETVKDQSGEKHWVVFDGPVDSLWIESMNTVLDDNKKLCLNSGQILTLTPYMTMMFEVEDLAVASPATVSRCGMVYMEPSAMGIQPLYDSWIDNLPDNLRAKNSLISSLNSLFVKFFEKCLEFIRKNCKELIPSMNNNLTQSFTKVLECFLEPYKETEIKKIASEDLEILESQLESLFLYSLVWSVGCTTDVEGRVKLDGFLRGILKENCPNLDFPNSGSLYDYKFNTETGTFESWKESFASFVVDPRFQFHEIVVPTMDSTRNMSLVKMLLAYKRHVLCPGPSGTGKSLNVNSVLTSELPENYQYISIAFSAQTTANQTQDTIDVKIEKRRKGIYGPPIGKKCVVFVDDLNMPRKEIYLAQPPIEILRQYLDHKGWYNRKELQFMNLEDIVLLAAMGPPGGGRTSITNRMVRHFNIVTFTELEEETISHIFSILTTFFFRKMGDSVKDTIGTLLKTSYSVYSQIRRELLPTPTKVHYTFNLRDIWRVFQGICGVSVGYLKEPINVVRVWFHENMRVYHDRLINEEDRLKIIELFNSKFVEFGVPNATEGQERILFGDFMGGREAEPRHYNHISDLAKLIKEMDNFQEDYNSDISLSASKKQLNLVLFLDACEHICRISRIIRQPQGNALLLGVGGSGRQSLSRFATFLANYKIFQIEVIKNYGIRSWRDDLKKVLMMCGIDNKPITFLFVDTQIINPQMLEDINNVLNSGDVTNLYNEKDMEEIMSACKGECKKKGLQPNKMNIFTQYLLRIKKNIHMVIAMSPLADSFTPRLRMFPSLVNSCTIDWFTEWPEEALINVGRGQLDYEDELEIRELLDPLVSMFKTIHKSVEGASSKYYNELRRYNYVTPTSYLELLKLFKSILKKKRSEFKKQINRLKSGLDKLNEANLAVEEMREILKKMQPELELASKETDEMMEKLSIDKEEAEKTKRQVAKEEETASKEQAEATELARIAMDSVAEANFTLEQSLKEVQKLRKDHLIEIKSFASPSRAVVVVCMAVCILNIESIQAKGGDIIVKTIPGTMKKEEDYFETAKKYLLSDPRDLFDMLLLYKKDNIKKEWIVKMEKLCLSDPDFTFQRAEKSSFAAKFLFLWAKAMYDYYKIFTETQPLRDQLEEKMRIVADATEDLRKKKVALEEVISRIRELERLYREKVFTKEELTAKIHECEVKLQRAQKLTEGLSEEKERWGRDITRLSKVFGVLPGDSVVAAGMVSYIGPFTSSYRQELESSWVQELDKLKIAHSENISMTTFLGDSVKIQNWNIAGLPKDETSIQNGIIIDTSLRWPLCIDPQNQANKFLKALGKDEVECPTGLDAIKSSDVNLMRTIELAIQFGKWILLENVGRELDPSLEPILLQQITTVGSSSSIVIGDKNIPYNDKFRFFMTTTIPNPHYAPEIFVKVAIINFAITPQGLEDQMLALIVSLENPNLEQKKTEIVRKNAQDKAELLKIEDSILQSLSESKGDISDILLDETLINKLQTSKKFAAEINQRVKDSLITEKQIDEARESYRSVAFRASLLFFCIIDLSSVDSMYQYSLQWYTNLFVMGVENAPASNEIEIRLGNLNSYFTYSLYENVCRSLFESHKLLFSLLLNVKLKAGDSSLNQDEWRFLLAGCTEDIKIPENPTNWISENSWPDIFRQLFGLNKLENFKGIEGQFMRSSDDFKKMFDSNVPHETDLPYPWKDKLSFFEKLLIIRILRPDKLIVALQVWITQEMGKEFIEPPPFEFSKCYKDSTAITPLIIVLSAGSDPISDFNRFAEEMGMSKRVDSISLGQGQGARAENYIRGAQQRGGWVLLQNCHLSVSWMPDLERICEEFNENLHKDFRLWLTSMPSPSFPISVLQNGVKMTLEPPKGLKNNLKRIYLKIDDKELDDCKKPFEFKKLLFAFSLFHAIIVERKKFGPIGWNIAYEFTNEDFNVCKKQLKMLLDEYEEPPYKVLNQLGAEINYGGRVTDDKDERLIKTILLNYINQDALADGHAFSESKIYISPHAEKQEDFLKYISGLPLNPSPEAFGMDHNTEITTSQNETFDLLQTVFSLQPRAAAGTGKSKEDVIEEVATTLQKKTPPPFDIEDIIRRYPTEYKESMNTVLVQEIFRYNKLLEVMFVTLADVKKAVRGKIVMSEDLEKLANSLSLNQVPHLWDEKGFLSMKPLMSWSKDLTRRVEFLTNWIDKGTPNVFWISGFFFPQAFITGTLQNYARRKNVAIDKLSFEFNFMDELKYSDIKEKPEEGCYIYGMYLEGACWDYELHMLDIPRPKELFSALPLIHLQPIESPAENNFVHKDGTYFCPMYKTVSRAGTLSTTGHSTNFVMFLELPTDKHSDFWIRSGVAAFLALKY